MPPENKRKLWEERLDAALGVAASAILFALMLITFADVVSRYLFNWPLRGAFEATELMLLVLIFAGLPLVHALCAAVMFFLAWQVWIKATRIAGYGDTTDVLRVPVGPFVYFMALMIGLTGVVHVLRVFVPGTLRASQATP